ncbi:MAG: hypothetical protein A3I61_02600 [Acidobacteria bacterium RIFCSPLOWO2_02_FULL_68_18]|nr:MAG: hypothetical protein A3I61_02600 [Acidobacteria bacterium RIFCSPLOWO2_02_FULL_68_18]OFW51658.1 MAG: hypothetical protein A3G77_12295 [Acidobacteria bacterium RIFCSPLOWO2_12_FULL_68_19]
MMRRSESFLRRCVAVLLLAMVTAGCQNGPDVRGPFEGQIVEAETGKPIEGAIVVVVWTHLMNYFEGGRDEIDARETVTDAEGKWRIPERPTPIWEGGIAGVRRRFYVFAPGYDVQDPAGTPRDQYAPREAKVTTLRRLITREERCEALPFVASTMSVAAVGKSPRFREAIARDRDTLGC